MKKTIAALALALAAFPAAAEHTHIIIEDGVFVPALRGSVDIWPRGIERSVPHTGHGVEIGLTGARGDDQQTRGAGDPPLRFGGQTFAAPATIEYDFRFSYFELAYRYRHFFGATKNFGIEALAGIGSAEMEITASTPAQRTTETLQNGGLVFGAGVVWNFRARTSLQSRITLFGSGEREGVSGAARFDVMVAHALARNIALRGGLVSWALRSERDEHENIASGNSHIDARFGGLGIGLDVTF